MPNTERYRSGIAVLTFFESRIGISCIEAERLKQQVMQCTSVYLEADEPGESAGEAAAEMQTAADFAMYALTEAKRKYWVHVGQHKCDPVRTKH